VANKRTKRKKIIKKKNKKNMRVLREESIGVYPHWAMAIKY